MGIDHRNVYAIIISKDGSLVEGIINYIIHVKINSGLVDDCHEGRQRRVLSYSRRENVNSAFSPESFQPPQGLTGEVQPQLEIAAVTRAVLLALNVLQ